MSDIRRLFIRNTDPLTALPKDLSYVPLLVIGPDGRWRLSRIEPALLARASEVEEITRAVQSAIALVNEAIAQKAASSDVTAQMAGVESEMHTALDALAQQIASKAASTVVAASIASVVDEMHTRFAAVEVEIGAKANAADLATQTTALQKAIDSLTTALGTLGKRVTDDEKADGDRMTAIEGRLAKKPDWRKVGEASVTQTSTLAIAAGSQPITTPLKGVTAADVLLVRPKAPLALGFGMSAGAISGVDQFTVGVTNPLIALSLGKATFAIPVEVFALS